MGVTVVRSSRSCRFCASRQVVGYGTTSRGIQRVLCRNCKKVSQISEAPRDGWAYPNKLISEALTLYYDGITIGQMKQKIEEQFGAKPDNSTFYRWIVYYTGMAARMLDLGPIMLGPEWILDEVRLDEKLEKTQEEVGDGELVWYCFDLETRFLISAQWLYGASSKRVDRKSRLIEFLEDAIKSSKRMPKSLISDNLPDQILKSRWCRLSESLVIRSGIKEVLRDYHPVEDFQSKLRTLNRVMGRLASSPTERSTKLRMKGWVLHYNFFKPQEELNGQTPSQAAQINTRIKSWGRVIKQDERFQGTWHRGD